VPAFFKATPSPEVTEPFCRVPSPEFSHAPTYSLLIHLCRFAVRFFLKTSFLEKGKEKKSFHLLFFFFLFRQFLKFFSFFPSMEAFAIILGTAFSRRSLSLRRNLWTFGDSDFTLFIATHVSILTLDFSKSFFKLSSFKIQDVPLPLFQVCHFGENFDSHTF
jgi:hypothetical protein